MLNPSRGFGGWLWLLACLAASCAEAAGQVTGTATYRERIVLPPDAVFEATLEDVTKADAPAEVIGQARVETPTHPPIRFQIAYDPARIVASHRYAVRARILVGGKLVFITDRNYPVLTRGHGRKVALLLRRADTSARADSTAGRLRAPPTRVAERFVRDGQGETCGASLSTESLEQTYWKLTHLGDAAVPVAPRQREAHLILDAKSGRVSGSTGCNRLMGGYELRGNTLAFGRIAATKMACVGGMDTEKAFMDALAQVKTWKIAGCELELFDSADKRVARFEARVP
jgi:putative lipoprotein